MHCMAGSPYYWCGFSFVYPCGAVQGTGLVSCVLHPTAVLPSFSSTP